MMFEFRHITRLSVRAGATTLAAAALCAGGVANAQFGTLGGTKGVGVVTQTGDTNPVNPTPATPVFLFGPIPGYTSIPYLAPGKLAVPFGSTVTFSVGGLSDAQSVMWTGDVEAAVNGATALCRVNGFTPMHVTALVVPDGTQFTCDIEPVYTALTGGLHFAIDAKPMNLSEGMTNEQTHALYNAAESLAGLTVLPDGSRATSTNRTLVATPFPVYSLAQRRFISDESVAALIEFRVDGKPVGVGSHFIPATGAHKVSVGPLANPEAFDLTVYDVSISSPDLVNGDIPADQSVTFFATTDPPGFEDSVNWMASTLFGSATPTLGHGATFTTTFSNTFGRVTPDKPITEWIGVKASNAIAGTDQTQGTQFFLDTDGTGPWTPTGAGWTIGAPLSDLGLDPDFAGTPELAALLAESGPNNKAIWFKAEDAPVGNDVFLDADGDGFVDNTGFTPAPFGTLQLAPMVVPVTDMAGNPLTVNLNFQQLAQAVSSPALGQNATLGGGTAIIFDDIEMRWVAVPNAIWIHFWMKVHILAKITTTSDVWTFHKDVKANGKIFNVRHTGTKTVTTTTIVHIPGSAHAWLKIPLADFVGGVANASPKSLGQAKYESTPVAAVITGDFPQPHAQTPNGLAIQAVINAAIAEWSARLQTAAPGRAMRIRFLWSTALPPGTLASTNWDLNGDKLPGAPKVAGVAPVDAEITINHNINWNLNIAMGPGPAQFDLLTLMRHEIAHALGLEGAIPAGPAGYPAYNANVDLTKNPPQWKGRRAFGTLLEPPADVSHLRTGSGDLMEPSINPGVRRGISATDLAMLVDAFSGTAAAYR